MHLTPAQTFRRIRFQSATCSAAGSEAFGRPDLHFELEPRIGRWLWFLISAAHERWLRLVRVALTSAAAQEYGLCPFMLRLLPPWYYIWYMDPQAPASYMQHLLSAPGSIGPWPTFDFVDLMDYFGTSIENALLGFHRTTASWYDEIACGCVHHQGVLDWLGNFHGCCCCCWSSSLYLWLGYSSRSFDSKISALINTCLWPKSTLLSFNSLEWYASRGSWILAVVLLAA